jgi:uncharacterized protein (TIGR02145 family)
MSVLSFALLRERTFFVHVSPRYPHLKGGRIMSIFCRKSKLSLVIAICFLSFGGCSKNPTTPQVHGTPTGTVTDTDGNVYNAVTIGTQVWMVENLKTTHYNDGTSIPLVTDPTAWGNLTTPGYCWYNDSVPYGNSYGALYNWHAVNTGKLAPIGWHVPTDSDWTVLYTYIDEPDAGGLLKDTGTTYWSSPNTGATNTTGFTALPGGYRDPSGAFGGIGGLGYWWSSTADGGPTRGFGLATHSTNFIFVNFNEVYGLSVRCIRNK